MVDIYGSHFEFGGKESKAYDLVIANVDTERVTLLNGVKKSITIYNKNAKKKIHVDDDYSASQLSFEVEIVREDGRCIEPYERRQIEKWLFNHRGFRKLYISLESDTRGETFEFIDGVMHRNYLNCRLINPSKIEYNGGVVGYRATLEADSDMWWQDPITKTFEINNANENSITTFTINVDTDLDEYIYPRVRIEMGAVPEGTNGIIRIINHSDDSTRYTTFFGMSSYSGVNMRGEYNFLSEGYYEKFADRNFIRLLDGENRFAVHGCVKSIEFEYSVRRRL